MKTENSAGMLSFKRLRHKLATVPVLGKMLRVCKKTVRLPRTFKRLFAQQREVLSSLDQMESLRQINRDLLDKLAIMQPLIDDYRHVCRRVAELEQLLVQAPVTTADRVAASLQTYRKAA